MQIYIKSYCPYCVKLISLLDGEKIPYEVIDINKQPDQRVTMEKLSGHTGVPQVALRDIIIYDYDTEETLVADIRSLLGMEERTNITSQFTLLT
ncbi:MAG: glutaredoxin [Candidatus Gracilibacteria bacterium]